MTIDPAHIDVEFTADGMLSGGDMSFGAEFRSDWLIGRSEWRDRIEAKKAAGGGLEQYNLKINDQNPESSCVCNAAETCFRTVWTRQLGVEHSIDFSPMSLYTRICSSRHSGSWMPDALAELEDNGILPEDTPANRARFKHVVHQNTPFIRERDLPDGWKQTAKHFRVIKGEWYRLPDDNEAFASALLSDMPICYGRSGHSIAALTLVYSDGRFLAKYAQSYGTDVGDNGYQYDSERNWNTDGAWCLRAVTMPSDVSKPAGGDQL
mgnify:FL=1